MASFADDVIKNLRVARAGAPETFLDTLRNKKSGDPVAFRVGENKFLKGIIEIDEKGAQLITFPKEGTPTEGTAFMVDEILQLTKLPFSYRVTGRSKFLVPDDEALQTQLDELKVAARANKLSENQINALSTGFVNWLRQSGLGRWSQKLTRSSRVASRREAENVVVRQDAIELKDKDLELEAKANPAKLKAEVEAEVKNPVNQRLLSRMTTASLLDDAEVATLQYQETVQNAQNQKKITPAVAEKLDLTKNPNWIKRVAIATVLGVSGGVLAGFLLMRNVQAATQEHQKDLNGCFLINDQTGAPPVKIKLLTCGHYDVTGALETCRTQIYSTANAATITECAVNQFNPCARNSKSRASDTSVPLVPNVCDTYLYNETNAPLSVPGVTVKHACQNPDGSALTASEACSPYCKTENFNLPPEYKVVCTEVDPPTAFVDLLQNLGVDVDTVLPPDPPSPPSAMTVASKPLVIAAGALGALTVILLAVYAYRRKKNYAKQ